jgi:hypothetical protein
MTPSAQFPVTPYIRQLNHEKLLDMWSERHPKAPWQTQGRNPIPGLQMGLSMKSPAVQP